MVSAVSGQAVGVDLSSHKAGTDNGTQQVGAAQPEAVEEPANAERPATLVTLSQTARALLDQADSTPTPRVVEMPAGGMTSEQVHNMFKVSKIEMELGRLDRREAMRATNTVFLEMSKASYDKVRNTPPKAPVLLNAEETETALKMLSDAGRTPGGESYGFLKDGLQYNFKDDGTVTVQEQGVATSKEDQRDLMELFEKSIKMHSKMLEDTSEKRSELNAQRDALLA